MGVLSPYERTADLEVITVNSNSTSHDDKTSVNTYLIRIQLYKT